MKTIAVTIKEGGEWRNWPDGLLDEEGCWAFREVHAIKFDNGCIWDARNGWRKNTKPRVRVKMGRS